jgi:hypothetical protein
MYVAMTYLPSPFLGSLIEQLEQVNRYFFQQNHLILFDLLGLYQFEMACTSSGHGICTKYDIL